MRAEASGYDAKFRCVAGHTHFDTFVYGQRFDFAHGGLFTRIAMQMYDVARPGHTWNPSTALDPATELAR